MDFIPKNFNTSINIDELTIDGKVSLLKLQQLRDKFLLIKKKIIDKMDRENPYTSEIHRDLSLQRDKVNEKLDNISFCFQAFEEYGNIHRHEVSNDANYETQRQRRNRLNKEAEKRAGDEKAKGWYYVTIDYKTIDFYKGGYKTKTLNGRVMANSTLDAYEKGCKKIYEKSEDNIPEPLRTSLVDFVGVLTDEIIKENEY